MTGDDHRRLEQRVNKLFRMIEEAGIDSTAEREDLDAVDRSLLELLTTFEGTFEGANNALGILSDRRPARSALESKKYTVRGADPTGA